MGEILKRSNTCVIGVPEEEEKIHIQMKVGENSPSLMKDNNKFKIFNKLHAEFFKK